MARRSDYDPFAPAAPAFPRARLLRADVPEANVDNLAERFEDMSQQAAVRFVRTLRQQADGDVAARFTVPEDLAELEGYKHAQLVDLAGALGVHVSGTKDELSERITERITSQPSDSQGDEDGDGDGGDDDEQQEGQGGDQQPAQTPDQPATQEPTQEPASEPTPQPDGTGETITVETTSDPLADPDAQPQGDDVPPAVVGTPDPANVPEVGDQQGAVTTTDGTEHEGVVPASAAVEQTPAAVETARVKAPAKSSKATSSS